VNLFVISLAALFAIASAQNPANGSIAGTLMLASGGPAAGIRVAAMAVPADPAQPGEASVFVSITQTDANGRYRLENVPPGSYYITAGFITLPTYYPGAAAPGPRSVVAVTAGATLAGYDFTTAVSVGVTVKGRVLMPSNRAGIASLSPSQVALSAQSQLNAPLRGDGSFEFQHVPPGTYSVLDKLGTESN
jgi:hypothetical protein